MFARLLRFYLTDMPGLASHGDVLFWAQRAFPISLSTRDKPTNAWNRHWEDLWSMRGSYQSISSSPFANVKCRFEAWPHTIHGDASSDFTLNQTTTLIQLLPNFERFQWIICDGCSMLTEEAYYSRTWSCSIWDLHMLYQVFRDFPDF